MFLNTCDLFLFLGKKLDLILGVDYAGLSYRVSLKSYF